MNKFTLLVFIASILLVGCTASKHLMNAPEPSPKEEIQRQEVQRILEVWHGKHISKAIRVWGTPHGISNTDTGSKIYIWQTPSLTFLQQAHREIISDKQSVNLGRRVTQAPETTIKNVSTYVSYRPKGCNLQNFGEKRFEPECPFSEFPFFSREAGGHKIIR